MRYKLIIFDVDGTLADSFPWLMDTVNKIADKFRFRRVKENEIDKLRGFAANKMLQYLGVSLWKMPLIAKYIRELMAEDISRIPLFEGVDSLLKQLSKEGVILAVVSSNTFENVRSILGSENAGLIRYYACGVSIFGKPAKIKDILKKSGIPPSEAIFIGDEIRDIEAAKRARIASGAVSWGYNKTEALKAHSPVELFTSIDEIAEKTA